MALTPGTRLGVYQITAPIGEGGMGQVWRATDTTLGRQVAIKILPDAFAADPERLARFEREAKTLASLNHPHIAAIYAVEKSSPSTLSASSGQAGSGQAGMYALVMELVEGDDLSQRIARLRAPGASARQAGMPLDEALAIAKQIAEALEAAHEQGIIHRDLKPANIKVRADGTVKVLDFGLAKALDPAAASSPEAMNSPTITSPAMTQAGMILGTAAYMAPEQAKGKAVDKRADIWAFGVVLYEMLTGQRLFSAETIAETLAHVMTREIDLGALPATTPRHIRTLLARCLVREPKQRLRDIGEARLALEGAFETAASPATQATASPHGRGPLLAALAVAAALIAAMAVPAVRHLRETPPPAPPEVRLEITTPATDSPLQFALSPDGRHIVFVASGDGASRLWVRSLGATTAQPLAGTEGAQLPFWSPDGRSIGFTAGNDLKRVELAGGVPRALAPVLSGRGSTWNEAGDILFASNSTGPLLRVSATGGAVTAVTTLGPQQSGHVVPFFLPDGRRFLFKALGAPDAQGIYLGSLDGSTPTRLTAAPEAGAFFRILYLSGGTGNASGPGPRSAEASGEGGWLLWERAGTLVAQRLDLDRQMLAGDPVTVADGVVSASVAATGLVAYRTGAGSQRQMTWVDRSGAPRGVGGDSDATSNLPRVSPDGRRVALGRSVQGNRDVWLMDGARASRLTFDAALDDYPVWSPDGTRIVFSSTRNSQYDLYLKLTNGAGVEETLVASDQAKIPTSWSTDGRFLLYFSLDPQTSSDLWVMPTDTRVPSVVLKTPNHERWGAFSPDGRWIAYQSNESGRMEIYVRRFVPPGAAGTPAAAAEGQWQVSTAGGIYPVWRRDGNELYYLNPAGAMMAAPITVVGDALEPGAPVVLFPTRIVGGGVDAQQGRQYDVAPDGRFLINTELPGDVAPITLILNWQPEGKK